jgi:hypothetical protein
MFALSARFKTLGRVLAINNTRRDYDRYVGVGARDLFLNRLDRVQAGGDGQRSVALRSRACYFELDLRAMICMDSILCLIFGVEANSRSIPP